VSSLDAANIAITKHPPARHNPHKEFNNNMDSMNGQHWQEERQYSSAYGTPPNDSISSCNPTMMNELYPHPQQHTATIHPSHHHSYNPQINNQSMDGSMAIWNGPPAAGYYDTQHMHHQQHMYHHHPTAKQNQYDQPMPPPYRGHHHGIPGHFIFQPGPPPKSSSTRHGHNQQYNAAGHHQMTYAPSHVSSSHHHYGAPQYHCPPPSHQYHHGGPQMHPHPYHYPHPGMPPSSYSCAHSSTQHDVPPQSSHAPNQIAQQHVMTSLQQPILTHDESTANNNNTVILPPKTPGKTYSTIKKVTPRTILKKKNVGIFSSSKMSSSNTPDNSMSSTTTSPTPSMTYLDSSSCDNTSPPSTDNVASSSSKGSVSFSPQVQYHYPESNSPQQDVIDNKKKGDTNGMIDEKRDELSPVDAIFAAGKLVSLLYVLLMYSCH